MIERQFIYHSGDSFIHGFLLFVRCGKFLVGYFRCELNSFLKDNSYIITPARPIRCVSGSLSASRTPRHGGGPGTMENKRTQNAIREEAFLARLLAHSSRRCSIAPHCSSRSRGRQYRECHCTGRKSIAGETNPESLSLLINHPDNVVRRDDATSPVSQTMIKSPVSGE